MPYCTKCGKEVNAGEAFCRYCGSRMTAQQSSPDRPLPPGRSAEIAAGISDADLAAFVGKNADVYLSKFRSFTADGSGSFAVTWHWPAFLFGSFWMLYRKLYLWAVIALVAGFIPYLGILSPFVFGMAANYLYYTAVRSRIRQVRSLPVLSDADRTSALARAGGTNTVAVVLVPLIIIAILAAIAIPSFVSYRHRAYDTQARTEVQDACRRLADIFDREPGRAEVTPEDLLNSGFSPSPDIEMMLLDGRRGSLGLSAQHKKGKRVFITDPVCNIREERKGPSEEV